jgi:PAS domain S-box-containing protein
VINLSDGSGLELLREMNSWQHGGKLPVIVITTARELELALQAMKLGASDYLIAENMTADSFCQAANYVIEQIKLVINQQQKIETALQQLNQELEARIEARTADLQRSESRLQDVLQFARITNWQLDPVTRKYVWSPEILNILRISPADQPHTYDQMTAHFTLDSQQLRENLIDRLINYGESYITRFKIIRGDCTVGHVLSKAKPHFNTAGEVTMITGILMDISEWQEAEENFKNSEQRFTTLANTIPVAIFCLNQAGECVYVNDFWSQITVCSLANTLGQVWWQAVHPDDRQRIYTSWIASLTSLSSYQTEGRTLKPDGSICWFYCQIVREFDSTGKHIGYIGTLTDISDRKANEETLHNLSTRLELAVKSAHIGIWEFDLIHDQIIWNSRMYELFNVSPPEIDLTDHALEKFYSFIHPDDLPDLLEEVAKVVRRENDLDTEFRIVRHDGRVVNLKVYAILTFDEHQQPKSMIGVNYDITEHKETEKEILRSRDLWQAVFHESADALFLVNAETLRNMDCNARAVAMFEANSKDDLIGICGQNLQKRVFTEREIQAIQQEMSTQGFWTLEIEYLSLKGKTFWGNLVAKPIMVAGQTMNLVRVSDISDRKQTEIALQESQRFIETVLETIPLPLFWKDCHSVFLGCNRQLSQVLGLEQPKDIIGKTDYDLLPLHSEAYGYRQDDQEIMASGQAKLAFSDKFTLANGETRWLESHKAPLRDGQNNIIGIVGMFQDITERKQVADQLQATNAQLAKATRLKDEFLANMSHELRTPLNAILGMSEGILEEIFGKITLAQEKAVRLIERSGKHLLDLINDILDLSKIEAGKLTLDFEVVSVSSLCYNSTDLVEQIALSKNIQLSTQIITDIDYIWVDERRIRQVLINLLSNAVKFTPTNGRVSLVVTEQAGEILFSVIDTGIGINQADLQNIFQPFVQIDSSLNRQHAGTGLGLALVEKIISQHQGNITVNSTIGQGSCFTVHLPYYPLSMLDYPNNQLSQNYTSITGHHTIPGRSPLILLADDHEGNRQTMEDYLIHKGYQIILAQNGEEAIALTKIHRPDLILMDIQMPRLTGLEAISLIRTDQTISHIPIIVITALALPGDAERCLKAGANQYLTKPIRFKILLETIENILSPSS